MQPAGVPPLAPQHRQAMQGFALRDPWLERLTRRVLCLAMLAAVVSVVQFLWGVYTEQSLNRGYYPGARVFTLVCSLLVPLCGYCGAKRGDPHLLCCFCGCNGLAGCLVAVGTLSAFMTMNILGYYINHCPPGHPESPSCPTEDFWRSACPTLHEGYTAQECYGYTEEHMNTVRAAFWVGFVIAVPVVCLFCCSFHWGYQLYDEVRRQPPLVEPPTTLLLQPGFVQQPGPSYQS